MLSEMGRHLGQKLFPYLLESFFQWSKPLQMALRKFFLVEEDALGYHSFSFLLAPASVSCLRS